MLTQSGSILIVRSSRIALEAIAAMSLVIAAVCYGGVFESAVFAIRMLWIAGLLLHIPLYFFDGNYRCTYPKHVFPAIVFFFLFLAYALIQSSSGLIALDSQRPATASVFTTFQAWLYPVFYGSFFFVLLPVLIERHRVQRLVVTVTAIAFVMSLFGVLQKVTGAEQIYGLDFEFVERGFFSTFFYENNFGTFAALTIPLAGAFAIYCFGRAKREGNVQSLRGRIGAELALMNRGPFFALMTTAVTVIALLLSDARAAVFVLVLFYAAAFLLMAMGPSRRVPLILFVLVGGMAALVATQNVFNQMIANYGAGSLLDGFQIIIRNMSMNWKLFLERPLFGWGFGTYYLLSPRYLAIGESFSHWQHFMQGKSDYFQVLIETGVVGAVPLFLGILILVLRPLFQSVGGSAFVKIFKVQAVFGILTFGCLILTDWHLATPLVAMLFIFQLALLTQTSNRLLRMKEEVRPPRRDRVSPTGRVVFSASIVLVCMFLLVVSVRHYRAFLLARGNTSLGLKRALEIEPHNHRLWHRRSLLKFEGETAIWRSGKENEALKAAKKAVELAPLYSPYWRQLAVVYYSQKNRKEAVAALEKAVALSSPNIPYRTQLILLYYEMYRDTLSMTHGMEYLSRARLIYRQIRNDLDESSRERLEELFRGQQMSVLSQSLD